MVVDVKGVEMDLMEDKRGGGGGGRELSCEYRREARAARGAVEVVERESCEGAAPWAEAEEEDPERARERERAAAKARAAAAAAPRPRGFKRLLQRARPRK